MNVAEKHGPLYRKRITTSRAAVDYSLLPFAMM
jgi:hypothetical protein